MPPLPHRDWIAAATLLLSACALSPPSMPCAGTSQTVDRLYLGRARPAGGEVGDDELRRFLAEVVTPRFPQGLTWTPAQGQWRGADGAIVGERSVVLDIVHGGSADERRRVSEIADGYKQRFGQEAVLRVSQPACVSF